MYHFEPFGRGPVAAKHTQDQRERMFSCRYLVGTWCDSDSDSAMRSRADINASYPTPNLEMTFKEDVASTRARKWFHTGHIASMPGR